LQHALLRNKQQILFIILHEEDNKLDSKLQRKPEQFDIVDGNSEIAHVGVSGRKVFDEGEKKYLLARVGGVVGSFEAFYH
jgi:hypothetical protein